MLQESAVSWERCDENSHIGPILIQHAIVGRAVVHKWGDFWCVVPIDFLDAPNHNSHHIPCSLMRLTHEKTEIYCSNLKTWEAVIAYAMPEKMSIPEGRYR